LSLKVYWLRRLHCLEGLSEPPASAGGGLVAAAPLMPPREKRPQRVEYSAEVSTGHESHDFRSRDDPETHTRSFVDCPPRSRLKGGKERLAVSGAVLAHCSQMMTRDVLDELAKYLGPGQSGF
jgi:hypothetical protein